MAEAQTAGTASGKLVIRNIGLMLSGDLGRPILDADTLVAVDGKIQDVLKENREIGGHFSISHSYTS